MSTIQSNSSSRVTFSASRVQAEQQKAQDYLQKTEIQSIDKELSEANKALEHFESTLNQSTTKILENSSLVKGNKTVLASLYAAPSNSAQNDALRAQTVDQYLKLSLFVSYAKDISLVKNTKQHDNLLRSLAQALGIDEVLKEFFGPKFETAGINNTLQAVENLLKNNPELQIETKTKSFLDDKVVKGIKADFAKNGLIQNGKVNACKTNAVKEFIEGKAQNFSKSLKPALKELFEQVSPAKNKRESFSLRLHVERCFAEKERGLKALINDLQSVLNTNLGIENNLEQNLLTLENEKKKVQVEIDSITKMIGRARNEIAKLRKQDPKTENIVIQEEIVARESKIEVLTKELFALNNSFKSFSHDRGLDLAKINTLVKAQRASLSRAKTNLQNFEHNKAKLAETISRSYAARSELISAVNRLNVAGSRGGILAGNDQVQAFTNNLGKVTAFAKDSPVAEFADPINQQITQAKTEILALTDVAFSKTVKADQQLASLAVALHKRLANNNTRIKALGDKDQNRIDKFNQIFDEQVRTSLVTRTQIVLDAFSKQTRIEGQHNAASSNLETQHLRELEELKQERQVEEQQLEDQKNGDLRTKIQVINYQIDHQIEQLQSAENLRDELTNELDSIEKKIEEKIKEVKAISVSASSDEKEAKLSQKERELSKIEDDKADLLAGLDGVGSKIKNILAAIEKFKEDAKTATTDIDAEFELTNAILQTSFKAKETVLVNTYNAQVKQLDDAFDNNTKDIANRKKSALTNLEETEKDYEAKRDSRVARVIESGATDLAGLKNDVDATNDYLKRIDTIRSGLKERLKRLDSQLVNLEEASSSSEQEQVKENLAHKGIELNGAFKDYRAALKFSSEDREGLIKFKEDFISKLELENPTNEKILHKLNKEKDRVEKLIEKEEQAYSDGISNIANSSDQGQIDAHYAQLSATVNNDEIKYLNERLEKVKKLLLIYRVDPALLEVVSSDSSSSTPVSSDPKEREPTKAEIQANRAAQASAQADRAAVRKANRDAAQADRDAARAQRAAARAQRAADKHEEQRLAQERGYTYDCFGK